MLKILHNPRCSKSRQTLALIEQSGEAVEIILYLENPLGHEELKKLLLKLEMSSARKIIRTGEKEYKELGLKSETSEAKLLEALAKYPRLMERPIVIKGSRAIIGYKPLVKQNRASLH